MTDGRLAWIIIVAILLIDQIIKIEVKTTMCLGESIRLTDWFYINFIENKGMAYGMSFMPKILLSTLRIIAISFIGWYISLAIRKKARTLYVVLLSMIVAGAAGNVIDCMFYGLIFNSSSRRVSPIPSISLRQNKSIITTPTLMQASAKLNTGEKNMKSLPPTIGTHSGHVVTISGK